MRSSILSAAALIFILGAGVDSLVQPPTSQRHQRLLNVDSVKRHSFPRQHQSIHERYSSFSQSPDWYTDSPTRHAPVSAYQEQKRIIQNTKTPSPNEVLWMRHATIDDIPALQQCNRALLPENYPDGFYEDYLRQFPDLTVIIESFSVEESTEGHGPNSSSSSVSSAQPVPIAYAMGCIREIKAATKQQQQWKYLNKRANSAVRYDNLGYRPLVRSGHTISLAVMPTHRKLGLATKLLDYLHDAMKHRYGAVVCDLSVRMSNERAIRLYENHGYNVSERLYNYYKNGKLEDGLKMQKVLSDYSSSSPESQITLPQQMLLQRPQKNFDSVSQW
ncbi:unnamed protein product [Cylindrotheca closterium]|uniref:N-acetyltransferase domain-containing protein n=1 Tax=Cylindrotheca closterium TaxID=2856 RepID=A0AAD2JHS4_9STRA|nr:unnamed protein product [Cylindrotheca closterium]